MEIEGSIGSVRLGCPVLFLSLAMSPSSAGEGDEQCNGALQLFALSRLGGMMHLTVRVKSNLQVK